MNLIDQRIIELINYGLQQEMIDPIDVDYCLNRLLYLLRRDEISMPFQLLNEIPPLTDILKDLTDYAVKANIIEMDAVELRDQFDTEIMDCLMPFPSTIANTFWKLYQESPNKATHYFYHLSQASNYIRTDRIAKNVSWRAQTDYGEIVITINLSKPEKDPRLIALQKQAAPTNYPKCVLCKENAGYHGRLNHPARANHRVLPLTLSGETWYLQYSPYVYYQEHCIVLSERHQPMKIDRNTFQRLLEFVHQFPHYFLGSNADLPIVGGSILNHDHYQGGREQLPMTHAKEVARLKVGGVEASILYWPLSVLRLKGSAIQPLVDVASTILTHWRGYSDETMDIRNETNGEQHNTITPIARFRKGQYELDLVFRNNLTTKEHPLGIFHPHEEHHHLKKENIGLIEVMGCAILPARLKEELRLIKEGLLGRIDLIQETTIEKHLHWVKEIQSKFRTFDEQTIDDIIKQEVALKFVRILEQCAVFPQNKKGLMAFKRFLDTCPLAIEDYTELSR